MSQCLPDGAVPPEAVYATAYGTDMTLSVKVVDERDRPVENAKVSFFSGPWRQPTETGAVTDSDGVASVRTKSTGAVEAHIQKTGWHSSFVTLHRPRSNGELFHGKAPANDVRVTGKAVLRERRNESPPEFNRRHWTISVPAQSAWHGFDLSARDFVAPGHQGVVADFEVLLEPHSEQYQTPHGNLVACKTEDRLRIRFLRPGDGWYADAAPFPESSFKYAYAVDPEKFSTGELAFSAKTQWTRCGRATRKRVVKPGLADGSYIVIRTRSIQDGDGNIASARYLVIDSTKFLDPGWTRYRCGGIGLGGYLLDSAAPPNLENLSFW